MRRTALAFIFAAAAAALLAGCAGGPAPRATINDPHVKITGTPRIMMTSPAASPSSCDGVFVTVQFGLLDDPEVTGCAKTTEPITAAAALSAVDVSTAGTKQYGDQVVCRVNGEPSASQPIAVPGHGVYTEKCQGMPAAFAYWAVWVRASAAGKWDYASSGVGTQQLKPGQTLGLKFTTGTDTTPPKG